LKIAIQKEDDITIIREHNCLNKEINDLISHKFKMANGKMTKVKFNVSQTLFDEK